MGIRISTASPVIPEGLGSVLHNQGHDKLGCLHSQRGGKRVNQDAAVLCQGYGSELGVFCGVFDGHGKNGHLVSKMVKERLPMLLLNELDAAAIADVMLVDISSESQATDDISSSSDSELHVWENAYENAFTDMDEKIKVAKKLDAAFSGSTAVVVVKQGDDLHIANLGDSRAILGTKDENGGILAVQLTIDLKPGTPDEKDRIKRSNGRVFALREEPGHERAWLPRVMSPGIAMSRTFGDFVMKRHGIIASPVVTHHRVTPEDMFILLATDGVWDVLSNEEVASIVWGAETEEMAAKAVVDAAMTAWKTKVPFDKPDDCTALCYFLQKKNQTDEASP